MTVNTAGIDFLYKIAPNFLFIMLTLIIFVFGMALFLLYVEHEFE